MADTPSPSATDPLTGAEREQLRTLLAKQELSENMARYCRGMDRKELDLMKSTYWPESTENHGMFVGTSHDFCDWTMELQEQLGHRANHYVTNMLVDLDGDRARRETAFIYVRVRPGGGPSDVLCGRYRDLCERREGVWKVLSRTCVWDWAQRLGPEADYAELFKIPPTSTFGGLYPDDPTYDADW